MSLIIFDFFLLKKNLFELKKFELALYTVKEKFLWFEHHFFDVL